MGGEASMMVRIQRLEGERAKLRDILAGIPEKDKVSREALTTAIMLLDGAMEQIWAVGKLTGEFAVKEDCNGLQDGVQ